MIAPSIRAHEFKTERKVYTRKDGQGTFSVSLHAIAEAGKLKDRTQRSSGAVCQDARQASNQFRTPKRCQLGPVDIWGSHLV